MLWQLMLHPLVPEQSSFGTTLDAGAKALLVLAGSVLTSYVGACSSDACAAALQNLARHCKVVGLFQRMAGDRPGKLDQLRSVSADMSTRAVMSLEDVHAFLQDCFMSLIPALHSPVHCPVPGTSPAKQLCPEELPQANQG